MIDLNWTQFKSFFTSRSLPIDYVETDDSYHLACENGLFLVRCLLDKETDTSDIEDFTDNFAASANTYQRRVMSIQDAPAAGSSFKAIPVSNVGLEGSSSRISSHNFCDKTTWWQTATQVVDQTVSSVAGLGLQFLTNRKNIIDLTHGKVFDEDNINHDGRYTVRVKVNGVLLGIEAGYSFDYSTGILVFVSAQIGKTVQVSYWYATSSDYVLAPKPGKALLVQHTEVQFSNDASISVSNPISFGTYVNGVKVAELKYKSEFDIIDDSNLGYEVPIFGTLTKSVIIFPFNYSTLKELKASDNVEIRCKLLGAPESDGLEPKLAGTKATVTFYCLSRNESA